MSSRLFAPVQQIRCQIAVSISPANLIEGFERGQDHRHRRGSRCHLDGAPREAKWDER
jgi:hypothetical protein